jgi:hypothetical protein
VAEDPPELTDETKTGCAGAAAVKEASTMLKPTAREMNAKILIA